MKRLLKVLLAAGALAIMTPTISFAQTGVGDAVQRDKPSTRGVGHPGGSMMRGMRGGNVYMGGRRLTRGRYMGGRMMRPQRRMAY